MSSILSGQASEAAVAQVAAALFNKVIKPNDLVVYRHNDGTRTTGSKLTKPAWVDEDGWVVCEIEGYIDPVSCARLTPFVSLPKPAKSRRKKQLLFET